MRNNPADHGKYEHTDVHARPLVIAAAALAVMTIVAAAIGYWMMRTMFVPQPSDPHVRADDTQRWNLPVRVQASPAAEFVQYRSEQEEITTSYATISSEPEIFSIPVEVALDVVAQNGLPEFQSILPEGTQALMDAVSDTSEDASGQNPQAGQDTQTQQNPQE